MNEPHKAPLLGPDPHTYELVGNEIRRDDGFVVRLAPIRPEDREWAKEQIEARKLPQKL